MHKSRLLTWTHWTTLASDLNWVITVEFGAHNWRTGNAARQTGASVALLLPSRALVIRGVVELAGLGALALFSLAQSVFGRLQVDGQKLDVLLHELNLLFEFLLLSHRRARHLRLARGSGLSIRLDGLDHVEPLDALLRLTMGLTWVSIGAA